MEAIKESTNLDELPPGRFKLTTRWPCNEAITPTFSLANAEDKVLVRGEINMATMVLTVWLATDFKVDTVSITVATFADFLARSWHFPLKLDVRATTQRLEQAPDFKT
eukprot:12659013-Prorocentrum_lima.AAC.1